MADIEPTAALARALAACREGEGVLACPQTAAALRALLRCVRPRAEGHAVTKALREERRRAVIVPAEAGSVRAQLLEQRDRRIEELVALRRELAEYDAGLQTRQAQAQEKLSERERRTRSCDLARRQLVHLRGHRCKMKRAARVIRGSAGQLTLHDDHDASPQTDRAVHDAIRQHLLHLVRRSFTAEGALLDESIRFLRGNGATLRRVASALGGLLAESKEEMANRRSSERKPAADTIDSNDGTNPRDPAASRKMRALLTLAHGQHIAAYEEVETLRILAHESRARAEELAAEVDKQLSQVDLSDSEWRVTSIAMKQDRDLAAARASLRIVQSRLNDMKIKVQLGKETADRLHDQRSRLRALEGDIREGRGRNSSLVADIRRLLKLVYERNGDIIRFCDAEIVRRGPALREACEHAQSALVQHALQHSLAQLSGTGNAQADAEPSEWQAASRTVVCALGAPSSTANQVCVVFVFMSMIMITDASLPTLPDVSSSPYVRPSFTTSLRAITSRPAR